MNTKMYILLMLSFVPIFTLHGVRKKSTNRVVTQLVRQRFPYCTKAREANKKTLIYSSKPYQTYQELLYKLKCERTQRKFTLSKKQNERKEVLKKESDLLEKLSNKMEDFTKLQKRAREQIQKLKTFKLQNQASSAKRTVLTEDKEYRLLAIAHGKVMRELININNDKILLRQKCDAIQKETDSLANNYRKVYWSIRAMYQISTRLQKSQSTFIQHAETVLDSRSVNFDALAEKYNNYFSDLKKGEINKNGYIVCAEEQSLGQAIQKRKKFNRDINTILASI